MNFETIRVRVEGPVCYLTLNRPQADNSIDRTLVDECRQAVEVHGGKDAVHVVVVEGLPQVFCVGADFEDYANDAGPGGAVAPEALYDLWEALGRGPFVSIAHVRGKANAGGVGFAAACDIVLADASAEFSLSELLFGLFPACVLPFLIRRIGFQKAHYMTLSTRPVAALEALDWGLVDACADNSADLLRKHLLRLRRLSKTGIQRYKAYTNSLDSIVTQARSTAVETNRKLFADPKNLEAIRRFARTGLFPWEN